MVKKTVSILATLLLMFAALSSTAHAVEGGSQNQQASIGYYVDARIPENQIDTSKTYFDLRMTPEQVQTLYVDIFNESSEAITVNVSAISASTNRNGVIDYRTPNIKDETLAIPFSEIAEVAEPTMTIPAKSKATAAIKVTMPNFEHDGIVLGGIGITKKISPTQSEEGSGQQGVAIQNEYSYVLGVKLTETDAKVLPDFEYIQTEAGLVNYQPAIIHSLRNSEAALVKDMQVDIKVYPSGSDQPIVSLNKQIDMAPNSVIPLGVSLDDGQLKPGDYRSAITLTLGEKIWNFESDFTITGDQVSTIHDTAVSNFAGPPLWAIILIICCVLSPLVCCFLILIFARRRRRKQKEQNEKLRATTENLS